MKYTYLLLVDLGSAGLDVPGRTGVGVAAASGGGCVGCGCRRGVGRDARVEAGAGGVVRVVVAAEADSGRRPRHRHFARAENAVERILRQDVRLAGGSRGGGGLPVPGLERALGGGGSAGAAAGDRGGLLLPLRDLDQFVLEKAVRLTSHALRVLRGDVFGLEEVHAQQRLHLFVLFFREERKGEKGKGREEKEKKEKRSVSSRSMPPLVPPRKQSTRRGCR